MGKIQALLRASSAEPFRILRFVFSGKSNKITPKKYTR